MISSATNLGVLNGSADLVLKNKVTKEIPITRCVTGPRNSDFEDGLFTLAMVISLTNTSGSAPKTRD